MRILLLVVFCLSASIAFCQTKGNQFVRFEHVGPEDKPFYSLTVSTGKESIPKIDRQSVFEQVVIATAASYADLCTGIKQNSYLKMTARHLKGDATFYKVTANGVSFMLDGGNAFMFFRKLTLFMRKKPADKEIADKLDRINTRIGR